MNTALKELMQPGPWDPTEPWMTVARRNELMDSLTDDRDTTMSVAAEMANSPILAARLLWTTHDPRRQPAHMPFRLWDYQEYIARWLMERVAVQEDGLIHKSRDMGVTWSVLAFLLHEWLFQDSFDALVTSRKKDLIDSLKEPDTIFERLRIALLHMPEEWKKLLLGETFDVEKHCPMMKLVNPLTASTITGEAPVKDFGRAGRYRCVVYDEAAFIELMRPMVASAGDSSNCHLLISTPNGHGNVFSERVEDGVTKKLTVHWSLHPLKRKGLTRVMSDGFTQLEEL